MRTVNVVGFVICSVGAIIWAIIDPAMWHNVLITAVVVFAIGMQRRPKPHSFDDPAVRRRIESIFESTAMHQARMEKHQPDGDDSGELRLPYRAS
ncbi:hypothetical protein ACFVH6_22335 [Spirillospora sp. NPDC127200]